MNYLVVIVQVKCSLYFCSVNQIELNMNQSIRSWLLLVILTYTAFIFNTTEFIPIGLLTDIAADFHISEAHAGLLISAYAWFVAIMSLPLMLTIGKYDFRKILLIIVGCFVPDASCCRKSVHRHRALRLLRTYCDVIQPCHAI